jgi:hypothetical protein
MKYQKLVTQDYNETVANIRAMLKRLSDKASNKHFATDPEKANRADLRDIRRIEINLKELSDQVFQEGLHAN